VRCPLFHARTQKKGAQEKYALRSLGTEKKKPENLRGGFGFRAGGSKKANDSVPPLFSSQGVKVEPTHTRPWARGLEKRKEGKVAHRGFLQGEKGTKTGGTGLGT